MPFPIRFTALLRNRPSRGGVASHSASWMSVLHPGTFWTCGAVPQTTSTPAFSRTLDKDAHAAIERDGASTCHKVIANRPGTGHDKAPPAAVRRQTLFLVEDDDAIHLALTGPGRRGGPGRRHPRFPGRRQAGR